MLLAHIIIALTSLGYTTYLFFSPSKPKIYTACSLMALTLGSGTYLVLNLKAHLLRACLTGLIYTAVVSVAIILAHKKLATQETKTD